MKEMDVGQFEQLVELSMTNDVACKRWKVSVMGIKLQLRVTRDINTCK